MDPVDGPILASLLGNTFLLPYFDSLLSKPVLPSSVIWAVKCSCLLVKTSANLIALDR